MSSLLIALVAATVGFVTGRSLEGAHEAHERFSSYRARSVASLGTWIRGTAVTVLEVACFVLLLYLIF